MTAKKKDILFLRSGKNEKENMHEVKQQKKDDTLAFIQRFKEEALVPMKVTLY